MDTINHTITLPILIYLILFLEDSNNCSYYEPPQHYRYDRNYYPGNRFSPISFPHNISF